MISRHIPIEPENDNYGRLARYIARIGEYAEDKEKPSLVWCAGCVGGDDYAEGIAEVPGRAGSENPCCVQQKLPPCGQLSPGG